MLEKKNGKRCGERIRPLGLLHLRDNTNDSRSPILAVVLMVLPHPGERLVLKARDRGLVCA